MSQERFFIQIPFFLVGDTCRGWLGIHLTQRPTKKQKTVSLRASKGLIHQE